jgi:hypothetical protein
MTVSGVVRVTDSSTNGTSYDGGVLQKDQSTESSDTPLCLDFGGGVTVGICFSEEDEQRFVAAGGALNAFADEQKVSNLGVDSGAIRHGKRKKARTTFLRTPEELRRAASEASEEGRFGRLLRRLTLKGQLALLGVVLGVVVVTSLIVGSLVSGLK